MQTKATNPHLSRTAGKNPDKGFKRSTAILRRRSAGANAPAFAGLGLPAIKLKSIPAFDVQFRLHGKHNPEDIYTKLESDVAKFFEVMNVRFIKPSSTYSACVRIEMLYKITLHLLHKINHNTQLSLHTSEDGQHYFEAYYYYPNTSLKIFTLELEALEVLKQKGSPILPHVMAIYKMAAVYPGFNSWHDEGYYGYIATEMMIEQANNYADEDEEVATNMIESANMYCNGGKAQLWLNRVSGTQITQAQISKLSRMKLSDYDATLKGWVLAGYNLLEEKNRQQLEELQNAHEFDEDEYGDVEPVELNRRFLICWNSDDAVMESVIESINMDSNEFSYYSPVSIYRIGSNEPYQYNDWFDRFMNWFELGWNVLNKIIEDNKK